jgi:hypothetical protein
MVGYTGMVTILSCGRSPPRPRPFELHHFGWTLGLIFALLSASRLLYTTRQRIRSTEDQACPVISVVSLKALSTFSRARPSRSAPYITMAREKPQRSPRIMVPQKGTLPQNWNDAW